MFSAGNFISQPGKDQWYREAKRRYPESLVLRAGAGERSGPGGQHAVVEKRPDGNINIWLCRAPRTAKKLVNEFRKVAPSDFSHSYENLGDPLAAVLEEAFGC